MTLERISIDPAVMNGQPCVRGTRLTVKRVLHILAEYKDREEIRKDYPRLDDEDIRQSLIYAAK
ncbi:MAG: DUF433 domain-containing protein [Thermoanaerobaculia bacterium]